MKFKVGDKVRVIGETNGWGKVKKGDIGEVIRINYHDSYAVKFPKDSCWYGKEKCFELVETKENTIQHTTKHQFKEGDGVTWKTCSVKEREEICLLLKKNKYKLYQDYRDYGWPGGNQFQNNFRFNRQGKWVTSSVAQVTNPMTFEEMKQLILGNVVSEPIYEVY